MKRKCIRKRNEKKILKRKCFYVKFEKQILDMSEKRRIEKSEKEKESFGFLL